MEEFMQFESEITESNLLSMDAPKQQSSYIKVLGVGGAGTNAVNHMYNCGIQGVDFIVCNTDQASLDSSPVTNKIKIGEGGLGAGNTPDRARMAAEVAETEIKSYLEHNTRMLFITAGMGGGTGTGASPVIARFAKEIKIESSEDEKILVVGVVTLPFSFEGRKRRTQAQEGIKRLKEEVDAIITINTDKLRDYGNFTMNRAFTMADDILLTAAKGISEMMTTNGRVHVDFRDVQSVMQNSGVALMGTGIAEGENRAMEAIQAATTSKLLNDNDISATKNILLYFLSSSKEEYEIRMEEIDTITNYLEQITNADVDYIWGMGTDDSLEGKLSITLVATGFQSQDMYTPPQRVPLSEKNTTTNNTLDNTPKQVQSQPPQVKEPFIKQQQTEETNEEVSQQTQDKSTETVIVHRLDANANPIKQTPVEPKPESATKLTGIWQGPTIAVATQPQIVEKEIVQQIPQTHQVSQRQTNISDIFPAAGNSREVSFEEKMERIQKVKKMLQTDEGINQIISSSPFDYSSMNFNQEYSVSNNISNYSINQEGEVVYGDNKILNAGVD